MLGIDLRGRRALVTGGSRGVGRATALLLARAGADVMITYQSRDADARAVVEELETLGVRALAHAGDIADAAVVDAIFARIMDAWGGLDIYVGNAGV